LLQAEEEEKLRSRTVSHLSEHMTIQHTQKRITPLKRLYSSQSQQKPAPVDSNKISKLSQSKKKGNYSNLDWANDNSMEDLFQDEVDSLF
jgi:hypothetical protein